MRLDFPSSFHNIQLSLSSSQNTDMPHEVHLKELISMSMKTGSPNSLFNY